MILTEWDCDLVCFSETWLHPHCTIESQFALSGFNFFRRDRHNGTHGGILIYVKSAIQCKRRTDMEQDVLEYVVLELLLPRIGKTFLYFCYRPPNFNPDTYFRLLSEQISLNTDAPNILVLGDFNAKHRSWDELSTPNCAGRLLYEMFTDFSLTQCVPTATRYSADGTSSSVLDLFATNRPDLVNQIKVTDPISDHCCVIATISAETTPGKKSMRTVYDYEHADWSGFRAHLQRAYLFQSTQGTTDIDIAWQTWYVMFCNIIERYVPLKTIIIRPRNKIWMTSELHKLCRKKLRLFHRAKNTQSKSDWEAYKRFRNYTNEEVERRKRLYFTRLHTTLTTKEQRGSHRWWMRVKKLARISASRPSIPDLVQDQTIASTDVAKANVLASFFARQSSNPTRQEGHSLSETDNDFPACLGAPFPMRDDHPKFTFPPISESTVLKRLQRLAVVKACGDASITNRILRETAPFISSSLTYLFNLSLSSAKIPTAWKHATVCPIFKQRGSQQDPSNYRPISLLPAIGKLMDAIQSEALCHYLVRNSILSDHQFGFLPGRSTTLQLVYVCDRWLEALDEGQGVLAVFMDFMKAFDKVSHRGLLYKLALCGISNSSLAWIYSYLWQRTLSVRVGPTLSSPQRVTAGVPQGSHLGPLLFLVFINDLEASVGGSCSTDIYADDTLLHHRTGRSPSDTDRLILQDAITAAETWALTWEGKFGHSKTKLLSIGKTSLAIVESDHYFEIGDEKIDQVKEHKHLGVYLTSDLRWSRHVEYITRNAKKRIGLLRCMIKVLPPDICSQLYLTYARPILEYASPLWHGSLTNDQANIFERLQASAARAILRSPWMTPKTCLLEQLGWSSLRWRRAIASVLLLHSLIEKPVPPTSSCIFPFSSSRSGRSSRKQHQMLLGYSRTARRTKSFFYHTALLWNSLPSHIQSIHNHAQFRLAIESHWSAYKYDTKQDIPF